VLNSYLCVRCRAFKDRVDSRRNAAGQRWKVDKKARVEAMRTQWDPVVDAFRCLYTDVVLTEHSGSHLSATCEHREPGDAASVVLVADLVNKMKSDLTVGEFQAMVRGLSRHFDGEPFDESAFPVDKHC
jgi:hypothetical protein